MSAQITSMEAKSRWQGRMRRVATHPLRLMASAPLWESLAFVLLNLPMGLLYFLVLFTLLSVGVGTLPVGVGLLLLALVPPLTLLGMRIELWRVNWLLHGELPSPASPPSLPAETFPAGGLPLRLLHALRALFRHSWALTHEHDIWRGLAYLLLLYPVGTMEAFGLKVQWDVLTTRVVRPAFAVAAGTPGTESSLWSLLGMTDPEWGPLVSLATVALGVIWLLALAYLIVGVAALHRVFAQWLLGPSLREEQARLEARVRALDRSRTRLVDAVLMERQRLERDLHDGAQQRLVALALDLGMAREKLATQPKEAQELVALAHDEAKRALAELRDLVRGIHPAVLTDRGLDPALSALAARCPVPVTVTVDLPERPPDVVEATAYFVVAEALTNVAKHSGASAASVDAHRVRKMLRLRIDDNGQGGANRADGTGLTGIADRVAALDGRLTITSPVGGPTTIVVELPWKEGASSSV